MPRTARASVGGVCHHVLNRGIGRTRVLHDDDNHTELIELLAAANERLSARPLGFCLMPSHFPQVLQ